MRDFFCVSIKEGLLAATLTLTIRLLEHELHARFARLGVPRASIHLHGSSSRKRANGPFRLLPFQ